MASTPNREEIYVFPDEVAPGWIYDKPNKNFYCREDNLKINPTICESTSCRYEIQIWDKSHLLKLLKSSEIFKKSTWAQEVNEGKNEDTILVKGTKIIEKKGCDTVAHQQHHIVETLNYKTYINMLIHFSCHLEKGAISTFESYLNEMLNGSAYSFIPRVIDDTCTEIYIYPHCGKTQRTNSIKHSVQEFCHFLKESKIGNNTSSIHVMEPTKGTACEYSYASACKNLKTTFSGTSKTARKQNNFQPSGSVMSERENTAENVVNRTQNQQYVVNENISNLGTNHVQYTVYYYEGLKQNSNSLYRTESIPVHNNDISAHTHYGSKSCLRNGKPFSSTERSLDLRKVDKSQKETRLAEVHSQCSSSQMRPLIDKLYDPENVSHVPEVKPYTKSIGPDGKGEKVGKVKPGDNALCSQDVGALTRSQTEIKNSKTYSTKNCSSECLAPVDHVVKSTSQSISNINKLQEKVKIPYSRETSNIVKEDGPTVVSEKQIHRFGKQTPDTGIMLNKDKGSAISQTRPNKYEHNSLASGVQSIKSTKGHENKAPVGNEPSKIYPDLQLEFPSESTKAYEDQEHLEMRLNNHNPEPRTGLASHCSKASESRAQLEKGLNNHSPCVKRDFTADNISQGTNLGYSSRENYKRKRDSLKSHAACNKNEEGKHIDFSTSHVKPSLVNDSRPSPQEIQSNAGVGRMTPKEKDGPHIVKSQFHGHNKVSVTGGKVNITLLPGYLKPVEETYDKCGMMRKFYGIHSDKKPITIILLGASGSGKTTLVNFAANYFSGVKSADDALVHVVGNSNDLRSHTTSITAYTFCFSEDDTPVTIIDTPGLNDSSGAEVRDHIQSLKTFLANAASQNYEIHAIGFVAQAHLVRLTSSERLVMDYVSKLFGQDIAENFIAFVTFADNQETPPVVEAMKSYGVNFKVFLKFNNSLISNIKTDKVDDLDRVYWRIGCKSWKKCLKSLQNLPALSVNTMKAVQNEVYATTVVESAERDLRDELRAFFNLCKDLKHKIKEVNLTGEKVWELAAILKCMKSTELNCSLDTENILVQFSQEVCKEIGDTNTTSYIQLLSLVPSRKLFKGTIGVLQAMTPIYKYVDDNINKLKRTLQQAPEVLYCHECKHHHPLRRIYPTSYYYVPFLGNSTLFISYKCTACSCRGNDHGVAPVDEKTSGSSQGFTTNKNKLLEHTLNCLSTVLSEFCMPGYRISVYRYLQYINYDAKYDFGVLMKDLQMAKK
ncbi:uncharacterized protein LOC121872938 isoform X1 [Homarus americanus]|uniref:uncharacterized protein LOC121872938 isoform X1 n=1 Tax=Homarus americanus TaxID=6706 RepID=UPI001C45043E|nr:uncharacterized protein LOC121872938 isoform X1 [Homarus americanus]